MARDRWSSRTTFILGAVGSAVGLGNLWRFPFLTFRWGGGTFLIPYALCLVFFGVPLLLMEITLGRQFQGGDPVCFASMHPRLVGIGWMSAYGSFILSTYYHVLIGWIVIFFFNSFRETLPWALDRSGNVTGVDRLGGAINFFVVDVLQDSGAIDVQETVNPLVVVATLFVWVCSYFSIFKGVAVVSQVVKFSVPVPLLTLAILLFNSVGKEGARDGITAYIGSWDFDVLQGPQVWQDAVGQVFFSIGVTFGIMTAYSSYRETRKGLLSDSLMIAFADTSVSFFAGFTVFTAVGVLANDLGVTFADESFRSLIGGSKLVFIAYPAALDGLATAPQFFSALFFLTTFLLAIDSAFSIVEAVIASLYDTNAGRAIPRWKLTLVVCVAGATFGLFFTLDNGGYWLDLVDFYLNNFIMIGVGALECIASMWVYGMADSMVEFGKVPILVYSISYFLSVAACSLSLLFLEEHKIIVSFFLWFNIWAAGFFVTFLISPPAPGKFYKLLFSGGASKLMTVMAVDEFDHEELVSLPYKITIHIWGFFTKYLIPAFLVMLLVTGANANYEKPIAGFAPVYQNIGTFEVLIAYGILFLFIFIKIDVYSDRVAEHQDKMAKRELELAEKNGAKLLEGGAGVEQPVSVALEAEAKQVSV